MKIVFVSDAIYPYNKGGKEKRLYELSTRLRKLGHDVHIYTMHWWQSTDLERTEDGVVLHAISPLYPLYKGNTRSIKQGIMFAIHCLKLWRVRWDKLDVDHMPFFPIYAAWLVCVTTGRRKTFYGTWHEALSRKDWTYYMGALGNIAALIERISIMMPYTVTAASRHTASLIASELHRTMRVHTVSSGIDTDLIDGLQPAEDSCDVLYSGRLVKDKNIDVLVDALGIVHRTLPTVTCTIIGHGIERQNLVQQIKKSKLGKVITMHNPLTDAADVYRAMKSARVFCLPSAREGFGIVALESLACGTPVITTDLPANAAKDFLTSTDTGLAVPLSATSFAEAIIQVLSAPKPPHLSQTMAAYDWEYVTKAQAKVYAG